MVVRKIVEIDENKCNGCGECIPACHEGALKIIDGKAKLISDKYCDGLGDCLGECPQDAIKIVEREAEEFDEEAVEVAKAANNFGGCCPVTTLEPLDGEKEGQKSQLKNWPVQIKLVPADAAYFEGAELLICADCVPFAYPKLHSNIIKDKTVLVGCPKLDDAGYYINKLSEIFRMNNIEKITVARMEVPCCGGLKLIVEKALERSGKQIPVENKVITIKGN